MLTRFTNTISIALNIELLIIKMYMTNDEMYLLLIVWLWIKQDKPLLWWNVYNFIKNSLSKEFLRHSPLISGIWNQSQNFINWIIIF